MTAWDFPCVMAVVRSRFLDCWSAISAERCGLPGRYPRWHGSYAAGRPHALPASSPCPCPAALRCAIYTVCRCRSRGSNG